MGPLGRLAWIVAISALAAGCASVPPQAPRKPEPPASGASAQQPLTSPAAVRTAPGEQKPERLASLQSPATFLLQKMSLEERIGQRFMGYIPQSGLSDAMLADVRAGRYGGFILYPWNYKNEQDVLQITSALQAAAQASERSVGLLIGVDQEGGRVTAFRFPDLAQFPSQFDWGRYQDPQFAQSVGYIVGTELRSLGVNMDFAPVLDLYPKDDSTIIGDRSLGPDPRVVSALGQAYIRGAQAAGIIPVAKHFPGHGSATVDSHLNLPVLDFTESQLFERDIVPFQAAVDAGVEVIMTAHILFPKIDAQWPVTLSPTFLKQILRKEMGFGGLVISDALTMGAISKNFDMHDTLRQCFLAGIDIILVNTSYDVPGLIAQSVAMVAAGEVPEGAIDDGTLRVLELKYRHGLIPVSGG